MAYSLSARHGEDDEGDFLLAFAALETLVNALDERNPLLSSDGVRWNALANKLKRCIKKHGESESLSEQQVDLIKAKITELKRPPIADKMLFHLIQNDVKVDDLWLEPSTLESRFDEGIRRAIQERNSLVHATSVSDFTELQGDLARIQLLFERLVLRLLGHRADASSRALHNAHWRER